MLLRRQRSIFHLGEEGGDAGAREHVNLVHDTTHHRLGGSGRQGQDAVVGLRILVAQQHRQNARTTAPSRSHIVLKRMVLLPTPASRRFGEPACSFLRVCSLCRRELSPDKDVFMYRGDQGFCSEECRRQEILRDQTREREAVIKKRWRSGFIQHHHGSRLAAAPAVDRGAPRRLLLVA